MMNYALQIQNFSDDAIVHYQLVLLVCQFKGQAHVCSSVVIRNEQDRKQRYEWPVTSATFNILCYLVEGENDLRITDKTDFILSKLRLIYRPVVHQYLLRPLYVICKGEHGVFQAPPGENNSIESACCRISLAAEMLQTFYAESLYEYCSERKTFSLPIGPKCEIFASDLHIDEARKMSSRQLWVHFAKEITSVHRSATSKFLAFLSCTRYHVSDQTVPLTSFRDMLLQTTCHVALGNGGLALIGTPCLFTWPETLHELADKTFDSTQVDKLRFLDDSANR